MFYPPDLTQVLQPIDRHIGIQYKTAVYKIIRSVSMKKIREGKNPATEGLSPAKKRILITRAVADTHERLAQSNAFRRSFIATGTWLPNDRSAGRQVCLQGVKFDYQGVCTPAAIEAHRCALEAEKTRKQAELEAAARIREEKKQAIAAKFMPALESSKRIWPNLEPLITIASSTSFSAIAQHIQSNFICAGSFPAFVISNEMKILSNSGINKEFPLKFNDIDVYYGRFGDGKIVRNRCT